MGLFTRRKDKLINYEIGFKDDLVSVNVSGNCDNDILIRLWICYFCKIVYNLGGSKSAEVMYKSFLNILLSIFSSGIDNYSDLRILNNKYKLSNESFNAKSWGYLEKNNIIKTKFSIKITEQDVIFSVISLLEYIVKKILEEGDTTSYLKLQYSIAELYRIYSTFDNKSNNMSNCIHIPELVISHINEYVKV